MQQPSAQIEFNPIGCLLYFCGSLKLVHRFRGVKIVDLVHLSSQYRMVSYYTIMQACVLNSKTLIYELVVGGVMLCGNSLIGVRKKSNMICCHFAINNTTPIMQSQQPDLFIHFINISLEKYDKLCGAKGYMTFIGLSVEIITNILIAGFMYDEHLPTSAKW